MANTLKMILGDIGKNTYQPQLFARPEDPETEDPLPNKYVSWCWISADELIEPGTYNIPEDQRDNLEWFYDNNFRLDKFGRLHIQQAMTLYEPESITII